MKMLAIFLVVLGAIFVIPLFIQGIKYNEGGFWMMVGAWIIIFFAMRWKLRKLREDPPSQRHLVNSDDDLNQR